MNIFLIFSMNLKTLTLDDYIFLGIVGAVLLIIICLIIVYLSISKSRNQSYKNRISAEFTDCITYVIDLKSQTVTWFKLKNLRKIRTVTYVEFLNFFEVKDQNSIRNRMISMLEVDTKKNGSDNVVLTNMLYKEGKRFLVYRTVLFASQIDKENKLIYLNADTLLHVPNDEFKKSVFKNLKSVNPLLLKHKPYYLLSEMKKAYEGNEFMKANLYFIKLFKMLDEAVVKNEYYVRYELMDYVCRCFKGVDLYYYLNPDNPQEVMFIDNTLMNSYQINHKIKEILDSINELLEIYGYLNTLVPVITASKVTSLNKNFETAYQDMQKFTQTVYNDNKNYSFFYPENSGMHSAEEGYKSEIDHILRNQLIDVYYSPVIHLLDRNSIIESYTFKIFPKSNIFKSYQDLEKFCAQYEEQQEVFSISSKKIISTFLTQKGDASFKLFFPIEMLDLPFAIKSFPHISNLNNANISFLFKNNVFIDFETDPYYLRTIQNLKLKSYELGLLITIGDFSLKDDTYKLFDLFVFDCSKLNNVKATSVDFINLHALLTKFVKFQKPIVCVNVNNWPLLELLSKSGVRYFGGDVISQYSSMLLPLDKRVIKKLSNLSK
jgi:hypothetical protein